MGLIGVVIASLVNLFLGSSALQFAISVIGVARVHRPDRLGHADDQGAVCRELRPGVQQKLAVFGALSLYLNFINIFQLLLSLTGQRGA